MTVINTLVLVCSFSLWCFKKNNCFHWLFFFWCLTANCCSLPVHLSQTPTSVLKLCYSHGAKIEYARRAKVEGIRLKLTFSLTSVTSKLFFFFFFKLHSCLLGIDLSISSLPACLKDSSDLYVTVGSIAAIEHPEVLLPFISALFMWVWLTLKSRGSCKNI